MRSKDVYGEVVISIVWKCECGIVNSEPIDSDYFNRGSCCRQEYCECENPYYCERNVCRCGAVSFVHAGV